MRRSVLVSLVLIGGCGGAPVGPRAPDAWAACQSGPRLSESDHGVALRVEHRHRMARPFRWTGFAVAIDGRCARRWGADELATSDDIAVFEGRLRPGPHAIHVLGRYRVEAGPFAVGTFVRAYLFEVRAEHALALTSPRIVRSVAREAGSVRTPLEERPRIAFEEHPFESR